MKHLVAVCALMLGGCYSFSTLGRARTVEEGHFEAWGAPEALVVATDSGGSVSRRSVSRSVRACSSIDRPIRTRDSIC